MLFNSIDFLLFFLVVTTAYFALPHKFRWLLLLISSCYFYAAFVPIYILILFVTIVIDYYAGIFIEKAPAHYKKRILLISILANVGILMFFKYYNFFIDNINSASSYFGANFSFPLLSIILPIGLSFHTFQAMSYTIEVYRGNQKAEKHFGIYALYVMFYPQLVAGPIERPQNVLHQFHEKKRFDAEKLWVGLRLMLWGLFKKVVIADRLSLLVDRLFENPGEYNSPLLIVGAVFFAIQIYCDFSGYSDMAIGAAKTMGFELMTNFNRPYFASNIKAFWDRWHISLSTWFRDYVYIPLGGNRVNEYRLYLNFFIVFILSGFWHGANWTFIVWGSLHAIYVLLNMFIVKRFDWFGLKDNMMFKFAGWIFTFCLVVFAWIFFRASSMDNAMEYISSLFANIYMPLQLKLPQVADELGFGYMSYGISVFSILILVLVELKVQPRFENNFVLKKDVVFSSVILLLVMFFGVFQKSSFIYFQF
ncbi:MAG: MBOAT family protein [Bacteroidetes bacterium]|nr:MBOAT family protein [Bacteroidota bacterium]